MDSTIIDQLVENIRQNPIQNQLFINGVAQDSKSKSLTERKSPIDLTLVSVSQVANREDTDLAVQFARSAFDKNNWSNPESAQARKKCLIKLAELIGRDTMHLAVTESLENGMPIGMCKNKNIAEAADCFRWHAEAIDKLYGESMWQTDNRFNTITKEPVGVVAVITPFNFPVMIAAWKIAPALAAGCTIVLKPSPLAPSATCMLGKLAIEAGFPPGVLNIITGEEECGIALSEHSDVDCIAFTGSGGVGRKIQEASAKTNLKRVWLELGGKTSSILFDDFSNPTKAAKMLAGAVFANQGQICNSPSRVLVQDTIYKKVLEELQAVADNIKIGDPFNSSNTMGPLINEQSVSLAKEKIQQAKDNGCRLICGGTTPEGLPPTYLSPTILADVDPYSPIAQDELFGPVMTVIPFKSEEEALAIANSTIFGLGAGLWTDDLSRAHRVSRLLKAGSVTVNVPLAGSLQLPFGGYRQSGNGRDKSLHAIDKYTELKATVFQFNT